MQLDLTQKQTTELKMTPKLRQAIDLLQYNTVDLRLFIEEQALDNPLIELEEKDPQVSFEASSSSALPSKQSVNPIDYTNPVDYAPQTVNETLDDILEQIDFLQMDYHTQQNLKYIVLNLNEHGFLSMDKETLSRELAVSIETLYGYLYWLYQLEPVGLAAENIPHCLALQAQHYFPEDEELLTIIENHLEALATNKWDAIAAALDISVEEVSQAVERIATLNQYPCAGLFQEETAFSYPDITITSTDKGFDITLQDTLLPKINVNQSYMNVKNSDAETAAYIQTNYQNCRWLINSIEQRQKTIEKIATYIVENQSEFLHQGFSVLKPMTLSDIADGIDMHESTISRATSNKVIAVPSGTFSMHQLFTAKLKSSANEFVSAAQVKWTLQRAIETENSSKPLSDQKLSDMLKEERGVTVSRRTVAKYREELQIPSSAKRKKIVV